LRVWQPARFGQLFTLGRPPAQPVGIILAALRARMLRLAAELADGACANLLPLSGVGQVVETFAAPDKELAFVFPSFPGPEDEALYAAARHFVAYATVPVYTEYLRWLGWGEAIAPMVDAWVAGERRRALEQAPVELVREVSLLGPYEAQRERLDEFHRRGIRTAILALWCPPPEVPRAIDGLTRAG
jgi:alkanesulfonate monooxygenase SsuD/methylene tetrahydromethanopterin reductase-like flavin-dependent oxidoreductase (luciferase family)